MIGTYSVVRGFNLIPVVDDHPLEKKKPLVGIKNTW
jgi:hypothetical protein